jgi:transcription elongation factor Elf1
MSKAGDICPNCGIHLLVLIKADRPHDIDHLQCTYCDSTFVIED